MKARRLIKVLPATAAVAFALMVTPASVVRAEEAPRTYTVEKGDNLYKIARKVYGNGRLWKVIYQANSGTVKNNYIIYKGQVLTIPNVDNSNKPATQPAALTPSLAQETQAPSPAQSSPAPETQPTASPSTPTPSQETQAAEAAQPSPSQATQPAAQPSPTQETPAAAAQPAPDSAQVQEYALDYNVIASWVDGGMIGNDESGSPVVMGLDAANEYAILIFGDNSDMTAVSFVGPITYIGDYATITDEANGMTLTFTVTQINDITLQLDMGDIGTATITGATKEEVLGTIRTAIENYRHIA